MFSKYQFFCVNVLFTLQNQLVPFTSFHINLQLFSIHVIVEKKHYKLFFLSVYYVRFFQPVKLYFYIQHILAIFSVMHIRYFHDILWEWCWVSTLEGLAVTLLSMGMVHQHKGINYSIYQEKYLKLLVFLLRGNGILHSKIRSLMFQDLDLRNFILMI